MLNRIKQYIDFKNISIAAFEKSIGMSNASFGKSLKTNGTIGADKIENILKIYKDINVEWLVTGKGLMLKDDSNVNLVREQSTIYNKKHVKHYDSPKIVTVNEYGNPNIVMLDSKAAAGLPANIDNPEYFKDLPAFSLPGNQFRGGTFIAIQVSGESMTRTLYHGDWLIAKFLENPCENIRNGYIHVVVKQDGVVVKRLLNRVKERGTIVLQSDNSEFYPTYEENIEEIIQIYEVKARLTFLMPNINLDMRKDINDLQVRVGRLEHKFPDENNNHFSI
jgi:phage repressor protein C with HTH and peptisase S24 domain